MSLLSEKYSRISTKIDSLWGTLECRTYMLALITDSRGGTRQGFEPQVAGEIIKLLNKHDDDFPQLNTVSDGIIIDEFRGVPNKVARLPQPEVHGFTFFTFMKWLGIIVALLIVIPRTKQYWSAFF